MEFSKTLKLHWRTLCGLILVYVSAIFSLNWLWGILFLFWVLPDLLSGVTYFISEVKRKETPVLYWAIMATWILMSAYVLLEPVLPMSWRDSAQVGVEYYTQPPAQGGSPTQVTGVYVDSLIAPTQTQQAGQPTETSEESTSESDLEPQDTLKYKQFHANSASFIGVPIQTSYYNDQYIKDIEELWAYFFTEDIFVVIPNIIDERVYVIYTGYDQPEKGYFKVLIGYQTSGVEEVYEGLEGLQVPEMDFAVFESMENPETFVTDTWTELEHAALPRANTFDLEVYTLAPKTYEVTQAELRISIQP